MEYTGKFLIKLPSILTFLFLLAVMIAVLERNENLKQCNLLSLCVLVPFFDRITKCKVGKFFSETYACFLSKRNCVSFRYLFILISLRLIKVITIVNTYAHADEASENSHKHDCATFCRNSKNSSILS